MKVFALLLSLVLPLSVPAQTKLTGTVIGNTTGYDYDTSASSSSVNTRDAAFDGSFDTFFSSSKTSGGWLGLDLGTPHVITKVGYSPRKIFVSGPEKMYMGRFEGANNPDFSDALPLHLILEESPISQMTYAAVPVTRAFRYVRYIGPLDARSEVSELEFYGTATEGSDTQFYCPADLPAVIVNVEGLKDPTNKTTELPSVISVISADGQKLVQDSGLVRLRGNYSMQMAKKPYRLKFAHKTKLLGSPAKAKKWTLVPSHGDKTLMRNLLSFDISRRVGLEYTPFCTPVNVWFNGDYKGCYQLCDQVEIAKGRIDIDEMDPQCTEGDSLTGGYFIEIDAHASEEPSWFKSTQGNPVTIKSPDSDEILAVQKQYIKDHFNKMEAALYNKNFDPETGYRKYLDADSYMKHFICEEFVGNTDAYWSVFMYKPRADEKIYTGPVWDLDLTFDNDGRTYPINNKTNWVYLSGGSVTGSMKTFTNTFLSDPLSMHELQQLWAKLRYTKSIDETTLHSQVDSYKEMLSLSQALNFKRWPIMNTKVHENPVIWGSYDAEVQNVKNYISNRIPWIDKKLSCSVSTYELAVSSAGWATVYIPFTADIPEGLTVYKIADVSNRKLLMKEVDYFEANQPYLVKALPGLYTIEGYRIPEWDGQSLGFLVGTSTDIPAPVDSYVLQKLNGLVCFYKVMDGEGNIPTVTKNKAYLSIPYFVLGAPARYEIEGEEETMLDIVEGSGSYFKIFDLSGRLVHEAHDQQDTMQQVLDELGKGIYMVTVDGQNYKKIYKQ